MERITYMDQNYAEIKARIDAALARSKKKNVTLVAAIKYTDAKHVNYLHRVLGVHDVGENRVQQLLERWEELDRDGLRIHFIGTLQRNKVKYIIDKVCMIHSLDSLSLAAEIEKQAAKHGITMDVLAEINSGCEENKSGLYPEEVEAFCLELAKFPHVNLRGFMTMAPKCEKKEEYCKYFQKTYQQCLDIWQKKLHNIGEPILSMGMSDSFEAAIEEGADMIRIGRALFQEREK
ncbi:MAG: YggS family pyridoxal phosphate-dependent enzyme [Ruminococcaceae bacterium]|nr:YggS family pyridoxal phosphate-dependent enzyme [Oscillospiraceae bacterium]